MASMYRPEMVYDALFLMTARADDALVKRGVEQSSCGRSSPDDTPSCSLGSLVFVLRACL
jgi:hypothetical protein